MFNIFLSTVLFGSGVITHAQTPYQKIDKVFTASCAHSVMGRTHRHIFKCGSMIVGFYPNDHFLFVDLGQFRTKTKIVGLGGDKDNITETPVQHMDDLAVIERKSIRSKECTWWRRHLPLPLRQDHYARKSLGVLDCKVTSATKPPYSIILNVKFHLLKDLHKQ